MEKEIVNVRKIILERNVISVVKDTMVFQIVNVSTHTVHN